jgi:primase-polymerase (primpol)-like protein
MSDRCSNDVPKSVDTVMKTIHEYAKSSNDNAERCWNLLNDRGGHADESRTDFELAQSLAFWCQNDANLVERVMEHSPRGRNRYDKWQKNSGSGRTNLEVTVYNAIRSRGSSVFQGHYVE